MGETEDNGSDPELVEEGESQYPKSWKFTLISIALCLSIFWMALDNTIVATAISKITDDFHSLDDVSWYGSAYFLCICAFQLVFGKLYTISPVKWVYLVVIGIFKVGNIVSTSASSSNALIVGRAVAGLGSAGILSGAILIVAYSVPLRKRPIFTGFVGAMYGVALVAGPLMGGAFTDNPSLGWPWCFWINLPLGAVTIFFILFFTTIRKSSAVLIPAIVCLLLALQNGGSKWAWSGARIIALFVVFDVLIIIFIGIQLWRRDLGTVPPRVLRKRSVWSSSFSVFCHGASFFSAIYYVPIWFQAIKGVDAEHSGIDTLPMMLGVVIFSILSGAGTTGIGYYTPWIIGSSVCMAIGGGLLSLFRVDSPSGVWIGYQALYGIGVGMGIQSPLIAVQTVLDLKDVPVGTAIIMFSQTLGGAVGISITQNVFLNQLVKNLATNVPQFPVDIVVRTGATELKNVVSPKFIDRVLFSYNQSLDQTFYVTTAFGALSLIGACFVEWKSVKGKKMGMPAPV